MSNDDNGICLMHQYIKVLISSVASFSECVSAFTLKHERLNTMSIELAEKVDYELIQKCKFTVEVNLSEF